MTRYTEFKICRQYKTHRLLSMKGEYIRRSGPRTFYIDLETFTDNDNRRTCGIWKRLKIK